MAVPGLTYRIEGGSALTHLEMNNNFRSLFYSSSIHDEGDNLRLHFDTVDGFTYHEIPLNAGSGGITVTGNSDNRILTATGNADIQGEDGFTFDGNLLTVTATMEFTSSTVEYTFSGSK